MLFCHVLFFFSSNSSVSENSFRNTILSTFCRAWFGWISSVIFHAFLSSEDFLLNYLFQKNSFWNIISVKQFRSRSGLTFVRPDLGPNCLKMLSTDRQRVMLIYFRKVHFHHQHCPRPFHFLDFSSKFVSLNCMLVSAATNFCKNVWTQIRLEKLWGLIWV